ncbi:26S proteasome regulatory subunit N6 [Enteropsectra breve]|nr:26S proteasome regulatory subunit N6 [Enteropsectra breve]
MDKELEKFSTNDEKENYIMKYSMKRIEENNYEDLLLMFKNMNKVWDGITTARITKIIKRVFEFVPITQHTYEKVLYFLEELIKWSENKKMLKLDLQCKHIHVLLNIGKYSECLDNIQNVTKDLKKYNDTTNLISLYIYESRAYYEIKDTPRARSALTSARALAVSSACPANLQAQIDLLNGMFLSDENAYDTSISYFIESLESFLQEKLFDNAKIAFRYIILNKLLSNKHKEVESVMNAKYADKLKEDEYAGLLRALNKACDSRDLKEYRELIVSNNWLVETDQYISRHLQAYYNVLLEKNIIKIIEPYSHIKISYISEKLGFDENMIEDKLRKMILDKIINGILDHMTGCLILFENKKKMEDEPSQVIHVLKSYLNMSK